PLRTLSGTPYRNFWKEEDGWGTWIRTRTNGVRVRGSTVNLFPIGRASERCGMKRCVYQDSAQGATTLGPRNPKDFQSVGFFVRKQARHPMWAFGRTMQPSALCRFYGLEHASSRQVRRCGGDNSSGRYSKCMVSK